MKQGYVKWFNDAKGYGFIACADAAGDIFVHFSAIIMSGYKSLETDMKVAFDLIETPKGLMAQNVQPIEPDVPLDGADLVTQS